VEDFEIIRRELKSYSPEVFAKPQIAVANKMDALDEPDRLKRLEAHLKKKKLPLLKISGATGEGVENLLESVWKAIVKERRSPSVASAAAKTVDKSERGDEKPDADSVDLLTPARSRRRGA
jgi:GTPase involved in cell partitioning and DNA repair